MSAKRLPFMRPRSATCRGLRFLSALLVVIATLAPLTITESTSAALGKFTNIDAQSVFSYPGWQQNVSPVRTRIPRLRVVMGQSREVSLALPITSVLVVSPEIATAELHGSALMLTGRQVGETILIAFNGQGRHTYLIEVVGRTRATIQPNISSVKSLASEQNGLSGSYTVSYSAPFGASPTLFRQSLAFRRRLTQERTLRFSSDVFKFMGPGNQDRVRATAPRFGLNQISLGIDARSGTVDLLDSQINLSPLSFNNYIMRGFHLVSKPVSQTHGMELFAGVARPSLSFFDQNQGRLAGVVMPVAQGQTWQLRAGVVAVSPQEGNHLGRGGTVWLFSGRYAPRHHVALEGEVDYANGGFSWRTRIDLNSRPFNAYGEILRLDRRSPLISIGAQPGGRDTETFALTWRPRSRLDVSFNYYHTAIVPPENAARARFERSTLFASANYRPTQNSRIGFRYALQQIETGRSAVGQHFKFETHTATISYDIRFNQNLFNNFELRLNSNRETQADAETESGIDLKDQLRFSFKGGSATAFLNYTHRTPSLAGLIVRNPQVLPPLLQRAFAADPIHFLQTNRGHSLAVLLPGVELPQTRGLDTGLRFQTAVSRINLAGEVRYITGKILDLEQRNIAASLSMNVRLDEANSVQVSGWKTFAFGATRSDPMLTVSYVHRFGGASGGGFQFSRLLGLDRGVIQGRVFFDQNSNGRDDEDEPGVSGMTIQVDGDHSAISDESGRFRFKLDAGEHSVALISRDFGVRLKATTTTEQNIFLSHRRTVNVSFGISNLGSIAGRVFNDLLLTGERIAGNAPGVAGVRVILYPTDKNGTPFSVMVDASGAYQFRNLAPGRYKLEVDVASLPANFRIPSQSAWPVIVNPLESFYFDIPQVAERAVSGVVFIDKDGNGKFDPEKDESVEGARVISREREVTTGAGGAYVFRGLPAGRIELRARTPWGTETLALALDLPAQPTTRRSVNLIVKR